MFKMDLKGAIVPNLYFIEFDDAGVCSNVQQLLGGKP